MTVYWLTVHVDIIFSFFFFLMIRRPPRSTLDRSSAASDVYKRQLKELTYVQAEPYSAADFQHGPMAMIEPGFPVLALSLIHISEPTRPY